MANTHVNAGQAVVGIVRLVKSYETSGENEAVAVATPTGRGRLRRLVAVMVKYSDPVTKNVTVTYDAAHGAAYDATLHTIALSNAATGSWIPTTDVWLAPDDAIVATAEAGGAGVTAAVTVLTEER